MQRLFVLGVSAFVCRGDDTHRSPSTSPRPIRPSPTARRRPATDHRIRGPGHKRAPRRSAMWSSTHSSTDASSRVSRPQRRLTSPHVGSALRSSAPPTRGRCARSLPPPRAPVSPPGLPGRRRDSDHGDAARPGKEAAPRPAAGYSPRPRPRHPGDASDPPRGRRDDHRRRGGSRRGSTSWMHPAAVGSCSTEPLCSPAAPASSRPKS